MPDEKLFAAAEAGQLATSKDIGVQAQRMLDDPKAKRRSPIFTNSGSTTIGLPASAKTPRSSPNGPLQSAT